MGLHQLAHCRPRGQLSNRCFETPGVITPTKGYGARKRRDNNKSKEYMRRCYNCKSPNHIVANCPYNSDNDEDEKKKHKKDKKEKKEKKMTFQKKKDGGYVVT